MKRFAWILLSFFIILKLQAQDVQVTLVDPCSTIDKKSTIVINDNTVAAFNTLSTPIAQSNTFNFTLSASANTSAGVYNASGNLVRTLWSGVRYDAGNYKAVWSGVMDDGTQAPPGNYQAKVLTNNVQYTWDGVIGNSSDSFTGDYILKGQLMEDLCFVGPKGFFANGYSEHTTSQKMFLSSNIHRLANEINAQTTQNSFHCCTDGNVVYWAGDGTDNNNGYTSYVFGAYPSDNANTNATMFSFSSGTALTVQNSGNGNVSYASAVSIGTSFINDIDVQKTGNFLFVVRSGINELKVHQKTTGALLQTITITGINSISCAGNNIWVANANSVKLYPVNSDGSLGTPTLSIPCGAGSRIDVSPTTGELAIADNAVYQVKFYNGTTGALNNTLGQAGGYDVSPWAANDRFGIIKYITYAPDGSFWVGDAQNYRYLHFDANRNYVEQMAWQPTSRTITADQNNPTRIFNQFVEYQRDYTKTLDNGTNGSWKFKANWNHNADITSGYAGFGKVLTFSNGRTYGTGSGIGWAELTNTGLRQFTNTADGDLGRDGSLFRQDNYNNDQEVVYFRQPPTFDGSGNLVYGSETEFCRTPSAAAVGRNFFYEPGNGYSQSVGHTATADRFIYFSHLSPSVSSSQDGTIGYHLGAVKKGGNQYLFRASQSTRTDYQGSYPTNGDFDIGNGWNTSANSQHSLTYAQVYDDDVFWNANGEFWRGGEINIWNHFTDDGLLIGHFGITGEAASDNGNNPAMMAGNALTTQVVKVGDDYYIDHCDESIHAGVHEWHVTNLGSIATQTSTLIVGGTTSLASALTTLMGGIPGASSFTGNSKWSFSPAFSPNWGAKTNVLSYRLDDPDVYMASSTNSLCTGTVSLGSNNSSNWTLTGKIAWAGFRSYKDANNTNFQVVDASGKVITNFTISYDPADSYRGSVKFNNVVMVKMENYPGQHLTQGMNDFSIVNNGGKITFTYLGYTTTVTAPFTPGANFNTPTNIKVNLNDGAGAAIAVCELSFSKQ